MWFYSVLVYLPMYYIFNDSDKLATAKVFSNRRTAADIKQIYDEQNDIDHNGLLILFNKIYRLFRFFFLKKTKYFCVQRSCT